MKITRLMQNVGLGQSTQDVCNFVTRVLWITIIGTAGWNMENPNRKISRLAECLSGYESARHNKKGPTKKM